MVDEICRYTVSVNKILFADTLDFDQWELTELLEPVQSGATM